MGRVGLSRLFTGLRLRKSGRQRGSAIVRGPIDGSHAVRLHSDRRASDLQPTWSHSGSRIAYVEQTGSRTQINPIDADGLQHRTLTSPDTYASGPVWLPGDTGIAYVSGAHTNALRVIRPDGSNPYTLPVLLADQVRWQGGSLPPRRC